MDNIINLETAQEKQVRPTKEEVLITQEEFLLNQEDFMINIVQEALQNILNAQFESFMQAGKYERTDSRNGLRNGAYWRSLHTRVGTITLRVCRDRDGRFQNNLFDHYQRHEKAFVMALAEMYIKGVSTRKVNDIVEKLCGHNVSKSMVSKITAELDESLEKWRSRLLTSEYPYVMFDARYEKIRDNDRVISKAVVIAIGITKEGIREIIGCWVVNSESFEAWDDCIAELKERGLKGTEFVVTDDNQGLKNALMKRFQGVKLQRCQVHFMRNFLSKLPKKDQKEAIVLLQEVFAAHSKERAIEALSHLTNHLREKKKPEIAEWLEENIEETLTVLELPQEHIKKMKSTNMIERFNEEIKRRTRVIRIFPNDQSCLRLVTAICQETTEKWSNRKYMDMGVLRK